MTPQIAIDGYEIIRRLGGGNMGVVYLAVRIDTGQQVAIKIISGGRSHEDDEKIAIEKNGAELQQRIAHLAPFHIVAVNRLQFQNSDLIVEMEYVPGESLGEILKTNKNLPPKRAAMIALELARMLDYLDSIEPPVVHGDLKPTNVLVKGEAEVKVVDFGIAKQLSNGSGTFNQYQSIPYSSPERLRTGDVDLHSDLWAVSVMLYEMTAGYHPFSAPLNMIRMRTLDGHGPDPLPSECPAGLRNIIFKALSSEQSDRYPSARELADDLERYLKGEPVAAAHPDPDATVRTRRPAAPPPIPRQSRLEFLRRHRADARLIGVGLILFILIWFGHNQYVVHDRAVDARQALLAGQLKLDQAFNEFIQLRDHSHLPLLLYSLQDTIKSKLMEEATDPILDYRQDQPTATLSEWQRAEDDLRHYLEIDPRSKVAQAREYICEAHIARLRLRRGPSNTKTINQAIGHLQQAAELMPDSPDPYLALANIYIYTQQDYDRGMAMQQAAIKRGHTAGRRDTAQTADTIRSNARHDLLLAQQLMDNDARRKHLKSSIRAFDSAIELYSQISGYGGSAAALRDAIQGKQQAQRMLDELDNR